MQLYTVRYILIGLKCICCPGSIQTHEGAYSIPHSWIWEGQGKGERRYTPLFAFTPTHGILDG